MAILINTNTRVILQGITGRMAHTHARYLKEYGVKLLAGVTPGRGGQEVEGVPVFNTIREAIDMVGMIDASLILTPPYAILDSALEAIEAGIPLLVIGTEFVPVHDTLRIREAAAKHGTRIIGPNTIGMISPGKCKVGIMPGMLYSEGNVGIVSRSGTLTHEAASSLTLRGIGQSSCVGIGGDAVPGSSFEDILELFRDDPETKIILLIGEIGGGAEEAAAAYLQKTQYPKPVVAFIAGITSPPGKQMGHAGAIISGSTGSGKSKREALQNAGVLVASDMDEAVDAIERMLGSV